MQWQHYVAEVSMMLPWAKSKYNLSQHQVMEQTYRSPTKQNQSFNWTLVCHSTSKSPTCYWSSCCKIAGTCSMGSRPPFEEINTDADPVKNASWMVWLRVDELDQPDTNQSVVSVCTQLCWVRRPVKVESPGSSLQMWGGTYNLQLHMTSRCVWHLFSNLLRSRDYQGSSTKDIVHGHGDDLGWWCGRKDKLNVLHIGR